MKKLTLALCLGLTLHSGDWAHANSEQFFTSSDGQRPYLIVTQDDEGASRRAPGIYVADSKGNWSAIVAGSVLAGRTSAGILAQLKTTEYDQRYGAIAVIDGKLTVLHLNTSVTNEATRATLGSPTHPFTDILHNQEIDVPPILSVDDINLYTAPATTDGELVLASIRLPQKSLHGDGVTFAFFVNVGKDKSPNCELAQPPVVIDYRFQTVNELRGLVHDESHQTGVISRLMLQSLTRRTAKDPLALKRWKDELSVRLQDFRFGKDMKSLPYFDVREGAPKLAELIADEVGQINRKLYQIYDPIRGHDGILFGRGRSVAFGHVDYDRNGRIDPISPDASAYRFYSPQTTGEVALAYINKALTLIYDAEVPYFLTIDKPTSNLPEKLAYHILRVALNEEAAQFYVVLSTETGSLKMTEAIILRQMGTSFEISRRYNLSTEFFEAAELRARMELHDDKVLFDLTTPKQKSVEAYRQIAQPTIPYLSLTDSTLPTVYEQAYKQTLETRDVNSFAEYRVFDHRGARNKLTGVYFVNRDEKEFKNVRGELLLKEGQDRPEIHSRSIRFGKPDTSTRLSITALDAGFEGGSTGFKLLTSLTFEGHHRSEGYDPVIDEYNFNLPFEQLSGITVLQGGKKSAEHVYLLFRFEPSKNGRGELPDGGLYSVALRLSVGRKKDKLELVPEKLRSGYLLKTSVSETELRHRIRRETTEGRLYLVGDADIDAQSNAYKLIDLSSGKEFFPNVSSDRTKKFVTEEEDEKTGTNDGFGTKLASWEVYSAFRLKERYPKMLSEIPDGDIEKQTKDAEKVFPKLQATLDAIAGNGEKPVHQVFLVPHYLKSEFIRAAFYLLADKERPKHPWAFNNFKMKFFAFDPQKSTQEEVLENLAALRQAKSTEKAVLFADMKDILAVERPTDVQDDDKQNAAALYLSDPTRDAIEKAKILPHLLYLIGTEGEALDLPAFEARKGWSQQTPSVIVATPSEWAEAQDQAAPEMYAGLKDRFQVNTSFFHGNWRVWPPNTPQTTVRVQQLQSQPVSEFENEVFPSLAKILKEAADPQKPPKHRVLIVPPELKTNILNHILTRWIHADPAKDPWSRANPTLALYQIDNGKVQSQDDVLENMEALTSTSEGTRGVLVGDLNDISKVGRAASGGGTDGFRIRDLAVSGEDGKRPDENREVEINEALYTPHALYLLATEGRRLQLDEFEKTKGAPYRSSQLLIGTEEEWEQLQTDLNPEGRTGLAESFEITELAVPPPETRVALLKRVLDRPEIMGLRYTFDASKSGMPGTEGLSQEDSRNALLASMVNRCEMLAKQHGKEVITAFIQYLNVFSASLVQDDMLRRRRVIDRKFAERLFSKVFSMPLNVDTLPAEDPLVRLSSPDAVMELQAAGYEGPIELKLRVLQALRAQTKFDPVRPIPSSIILYGDTRSGKTFLFKTLCHMLDLQMYDYARPEDPGAQAIIINVGKLRPNPADKPGNPMSPLTDKKSHSGNPEVMTVDEAMKHLHHFLSLPNGFRGYVLFDDMHFASEEVRSQIITVMRSFFEVGNGMYRVTSLRGKTSDIPLRNVSMFMTLNPTDDLEKIRKFKNKGDDVEMVMASLFGHNVNVDRSFLERWSLLLNLSLFPVEAKAPKLRDSVRDAARDAFNNQNRLVLVAPATITAVANQFAKENANFLSRATPELIARATDQQLSSAVTVVVPKRNSVLPTGSEPPWKAGWEEASGRSGSEIEAYIRNATVAVPVQGRIDGQLEFLKIILDTYRIQVFENLVKAVGQDVRYAGTFEQHRRLLAPVLHGVTAHLVKNAYLPVSSLGLDPYDFGATAKAQQERFRKIIENQPDTSRSYFPIQFGDELPRTGALAELVDHNQHKERERNRAHILSETVDKMAPIFQTFLESFLRIPSSNLPASDAWLRSLKSDDPEQPNKILGKQLADLFLDFYDELYRENIAETIRPQDFRDLTTYDAVRLFLLVIDKSITKLYWGKTVGFLGRSVDLATRDLALAQLQGVQHYIFNSKFSLVRPTTHELILQIASNSEAFRQWKEPQRDRAAADFQTKCSRLLVQAGG